MSVALMKVLLVFAVLLAGILFLAVGLGSDLPFVKYKEIEAYGVPVGVVLLLIGVALAAFWKVSTTKTIEKRHTETKSDIDGAATTTTTSETITTITTLAEPPH